MVSRGARSTVAGFAWRDEISERFFNRAQIDFGSAGGLQGGDGFFDRSEIDDGCLGMGEGGKGIGARKRFQPFAQALQLFDARLQSGLGFLHETGQLAGGEGGLGGIARGRLDPVHELIELGERFKEGVRGARFGRLRGLTPLEVLDVEDHDREETPEKDEESEDGREPGGQLVAFGNEESDRAADKQEITDPAKGAHYLVKKEFDSYRSEALSA